MKKYRWSWCLEVKPQDLWVGIYWKLDRTVWVTQLDIWVCIVPMLPLHITREHHEWKEERVYPWL
jgi:hypothetical protein